MYLFVYVHWKELYRQLKEKPKPGRSITPDGCTLAHGAEQQLRKKEALAWSSLTICTPFRACVTHRKENGPTLQRRWAQSGELIVPVSKLLGGSGRRRKMWCRMRNKLEFMKGSRQWWWGCGTDPKAVAPLQLRDQLQPPYWDPRGTTCFITQKNQTTECEDRYRTVYSSIFSLYFKGKKTISTAKGAIVLNTENICSKVWRKSVHGHIFNWAVKINSALV